MSELTHINCVALTARFPVGKPVVPAALMNRPTRGERRFAYWALAECILAYYVGTDEGVSEVLHVAGEKRLHRCVSRICDTGYIPLPRSLTRYARSFDCGERKWLTNGAEISWKMPGRYLTGSERAAAKPFFHRLRPPDKHHEI
jgi:hypothetical protein